MISKKQIDAEGRFLAFAKTLSGAECIDELDLTSDQKEARKADYFFDNRRIICELKSLKTDTSVKVEKLLAPHKNRPEWPLFLGAVELRKILKHLPDGDRINKELFEAITTALKDLVRSANSQIRQTKESFGLPKAGGMLVILNDHVDILSPDVVAYKVKALFRKKTPRGQSWFPEINAVWIINESHYQEVTPDLDGLPGMIMWNSVPDSENVTGYIDNFLQPRWAAFNGVPFIRMDGNVLKDFSFQSLRKKRIEASGNITRHQLWRKQYGKVPYLRDLSKQELRDYLVRLLSALAPGFMKGATETQRSLMRELMEPWTHLLEEMNFRALDLREFSPVLRHLGSKIMERVGSATSEEELRVLIKQEKQGAVTIDYHTRGTTANIHLYALSLAATRATEGGVDVEHVASYAPPSINTTQDAADYGLKEARKKWPSEEGWSHKVDVRPIQMKVEFGNHLSA
jgi:hypothetical protein